MLTTSNRPTNPCEPRVGIRTDPKTRQMIERKYKSQMADQICYAVLCVFSYVAAGLDEKRRKQRSNEPPRKA